MARMNWSGLDGVMRELTQMEKTAGPLTEKMLDAGAEVIVQAWKDTISQTFRKQPGAMHKSVKAKKKSDGSREIYPQGTDSRGVRNAEKAFIQHYGSSRIKATGFVDRAEAEAEGPAVEAMQRIWDEAT